MPVVDGENNIRCKTDSTIGPAMRPLLGPKPEMRNAEGEGFHRYGMVSCRIVAISDDNCRVSRLSRKSQDDTAQSSVWRFADLCQMWRIGCEEMSPRLKRPSAPASYDNVETATKELGTIWVLDTINRALANAKVHRVAIRERRRIGEIPEDTCCTSMEPDGSCRDHPGMRFGKRGNE